MVEIKPTRITNVEEAREWISAYGKLRVHQYTRALWLLIGISVLLGVLSVGICLMFEELGVFATACVTLSPLFQGALIRFIHCFYCSCICNRALMDLSFFDGCSDDFVYNYATYYACFVKEQPWHARGDIDLDYDSLYESIREKNARCLKMAVLRRNIVVSLYIGMMLFGATNNGRAFMSEAERLIGDNWVLGNFAYLLCGIVVFGGLQFMAYAIDFASNYKGYEKALDEGKVTSLELFDAARRYELSGYLFPIYDTNPGGTVTQDAAQRVPDGEGNAWEADMGCASK